MAIPHDVMQYLTRASEVGFRSRRARLVEFKCEIWGDENDQFVEEWAPRVHLFVEAALGPFGKEPLPEIKLLSDAHHASGANASFEPSTGQIRLSDALAGKRGTILEKMVHEMTHASWAQWPEGDCFYEEGYVDYSVWVMAHAPRWGQYRDEMIEASAHNIATRRQRAFLNQCDWDRKRWSGGLYASQVMGPWIISIMRGKKMEGNLTW